jgi:hypothetical protein
MDENLGVGVRGEAVPALLELAPQLEVPGAGAAAAALAALEEGEAVRTAGPPLRVPPY